MVEADENERDERLISAINYGLINRNVVQMVDKFSEKNTLNKSHFVDGIVDPGLKSIDSLISKMYRKTHIDLDYDFSLTDVKDIIRCSIIVDNYNQIIPLIRELRKSIPSLTGDICQNGTGYIGIHLSLIINGFNAEMQISTREAWYAKQAGEEIYERWRNFNLTKEARDLYLLSNEEQRQKQARKLYSQYNLKSNQLSYCRSMFASLHKYTKLDKLKEYINAVLYLNNYNHIESNNEELRKYNIKIKDMKSKQELLNNCQNYLSLAEESKKELIECANKALDIVRKTKDIDCTILLNKQEKDFVLLKKKYFSLLTERMKIKFNGEFEIIKYISKLNKIANKLAFDNINYLKYNSIDELSLDINNEDIVKLEELAEQYIFSKKYFLSLIDIKEDKND